MGSIPGSGRFPEGNSYPLQYPCLENSIGSGAWQATVLRVAELDRTEQLLEENSCLLIVVND